MCSSDESFVTADDDTSFVSVVSNVVSLGEELKSVFTPYTKNLNICHINAQSIPGHYTDALESFDIKALDAVLVSESFLKPSLPSTFFPIPGCVLIRNDRTGKGGGGVAIYLKSHIPYKIISQSSSLYTASPEFIFIEIDVGVRLALGVVYVPPTIDHTNLESLLETISSDYNRVIIMGDFNSCMIEQKPRARRLRTMIESANLLILDLTPTHHTSTNDSLLDLIVCSDTDLIATHGQLSAPAFSHHDLIFASIKIKTPKPKPVILNQRNFAGIDTADFERHAACTKWEKVETFETIDEKVDFMSSNIISIFDKYAPVHPVKIKHRPTPWINDTMRKAMARRDRAFRKFKKDRSTDNWDFYKKLRNHCNQICRRCKRRYIAEQIELSSPAGLWRFLKSLGFGKSKSVDTAIPLSLNELNNHFSSSLKIKPNIKLDTLLEITDLPRLNITQFEFVHVSQDAIRKIFSKLKSKAVGCDDIGRIMVMRLIDHILPPIVHIINFSLQSGQFPDQWRKAFVLPLPKTANPLLPNQFRPISILPFLSKVIESIVHKQVTEFLTDGDLLNPFQSGFRVGHSTTTALLKVTEDIRAAMEKSQVTVLVLIDFSNAFNVVDHDLLLATLNHLNFSTPAIKWFSSYLSGRRQSVRSGQSFSDWCELEVGVPQGGILSPLLFSLFINMLSTRLNCNYHFYADDLQLYNHSDTDNLEASLAALNTDLLQLKTWSENYGIQVNPNKCQAIIIGSTRQHAKIDLTSLTPLVYSNCPIPFSPVVKNLGLLLDANLNWSAQVKEVSRKFFASLHSIIRFKKFLPIKTKISLVNSLLLPIIDYADITYPDLNQDLLNKLDRLLNTCIRFIYGLRKYDHVSEYRSKLKWLPIRERRHRRTLCLLFSILNENNSPQYLKSKFSFLSDSHNRNLRSTNTLALSTPMHTTSSRGNSFEVSAVRLWNALPSNIQRAPNKLVFKRLVYEHLLKQDSSKRNA